MPNSGENFSDALALRSPFVAEGSIDSKYKAVQMYVGVLQLDEDEITGAAYGVGAASVTDNGDGTDRWTMALQHDAQENRQLYNGPAVGFVLVEMPGNRFTGWIDRNITLFGGSDKPQKKAAANGGAVDTNRILLELGNVLTAAGRG